MKKEHKGEILILSSSIFFAITAILVKVLTNTFSALFVILIRFIIGIILSISFIKITKASFKGLKSWDSVWRGFTGAAAMVLFYVSIQLSSSARASMLNLTYPFFVLLLGGLFYRQRITKKQVYSLILSIIGVLFVFYDGTTYGFLGNFMGLLSGFFAGFAVHYISRLRKKGVSSYTVYLSACLFGLIPALFAFKEYTLINSNNIIMLGIIGVSTFIAQYLMTKGYKYVTPNRGSILMYSYIPIITLLSYFFVDEVITFRFIIGMVLIFFGILVKDKPCVGNGC